MLAFHEGAFPLDRHGVALSPTGGHPWKPGEDSHINHACTNHTNARISFKLLPADSRPKTFSAQASSRATCLERCGSRKKCLATRRKTLAQIGGRRNTLSRNINHACHHRNNLRHIACEIPCHDFSGFIISLT